MRAEDVLEELAGLHDRLTKAASGLTPDQLDRVPAEGANSIAVLITHTLGSEADWLSRAAGRTIVRDRPSEFTTRQKTAEDLVSAIERASRVAPELVETAIAAGVDTMRAGGSLAGTSSARTISYCLAHALAHTAEHVGHAEVARQVVTERSN